ncbi:hypothetical protein [Brevibacillus laterosporus]|uniref:hypothetical protein n=1 Tax=Brevibacillus laterosporus TaxID=1465 RepID=UPI002E1BACA6|nr:hypothetical protein [Brevibacillus laterosporus]MED1667176.1 hypothetical protein [Brevibacillus laterosporus]MED1719756.1 hypothetical protein [Brevibacillus laterosporus]
MFRRMFILRQPLKSNVAFFKPNFSVFEIISNKEWEDIKSKGEKKEGGFQVENVLIKLITDNQKVIDNLQDGILCGGDSQIVANNAVDEWINTYIMN